ncbi:hypothetical protein ACIBMZ_25530 [Micromonospora sp. NPDC049900]|uniref:hypothetical protein n=1 Tax=Micromonospora sp. NPDC049900 TaxID=3364275 RepID=UPI00379FB01D
MTEPFERWELPTRLALSDQGVGHHLANPIIADVRTHCELSGQSPYDAFGDPEEFALTAAAEQPAHLRQNVDRNGMLPADYLTGSVFALVLLGLGAMIFYAILERTLTFTTTPAGLAGLIMACLAFTACAVPDALRAAGRPRLATWSFALVGLFVGLGASCFVLLPKEPAARVPVLGIVVVALLLLWLMTRRPATPKQPVDYVPPTPRTAPDDDPDAWYRRLSGLLVGRYDLPPERATDLAREARDHLTAAGGTPTAEFGPVEEYARDLAEHEPQRRVPFWRTTWAELIATLVAVQLSVAAFFAWTDEGHVWAAYGVALPGTLIAVVIAIRLALRLFRRG